MILFLVSTVLVLLFHPSKATTTLYGTVCVEQTLWPISVNEKTGAQTRLGSTGAPREAQAQGYSCANANVLFVLGYNENTTKANLVGFDIKDGSVKYDVPSLPFIESAFVGVGQQIACDLQEVVVVGHDNTNGSHHVLAYNPDTQVTRSVVQIPGSNIGILGGTSTIDTKRGILYALFASNNTKTKQIQIDMYAVSIRKGQDMGKFEIVPTDNAVGHNFGAMKYDAQLDAVVGFASDPKTNRRQVMTMAGAPLGTPRTWKAIGDVVGFEMEDGAIIAIDGTNNVMYAIIQPSPTGPQSYVNASGAACASCAKDSFCCRDPTQPQDQGACYTHECSMIPTGSGGLNTSEPFRLVTMDLAAKATVISSPPLCTLKAGDCPWQLDML